MRLVARAARALTREHPNIRYHLYSGNAEDVTERLDKGLLDFGILIEPVSLERYDYIQLPAADTWGLLMRRDHPLARKQVICPGTCWGSPAGVPPADGGQHFLRVAGPECPVPEAGGHLQPYL